MPPLTDPILAWRDYLALPRDPHTWLIQDLLPVGGTLLAYGEEKVGKSFAILQLSLAIGGTSPNWLGFPISRQGRVVYIQLDTPRSLWMERLDKIGISDAADLYFADRESLETWPFDILDPDHFRKLSVFLAQLAPVAVIIDTLREVHSADEDKSTAMRNVIGALVAATQPAALILVAHSRKPNSDRGFDVLHDNRGSGYVAGRMDGIVRFTKKALYYTGRAIEADSVKLERLPNGLWIPSRSDEDALRDNIMVDPTLTTLADQARALSALTGKEYEACRKIIQRT